MSNVYPFPAQSRIREKAAQWLARLDSETMTAADGEELRSWLQSDPAHRDALIHLLAVYNRSDLLASGIGTATGPLLSETPPHRFPWRAVAALLLAAAVGIASLSEFNQTPATPHQSSVITATADNYATAIGEQERYDLPDGSVVTLNTNSRIEIDFNEGRRRVHLLTGEAYFDVASDPTRRFTVIAGDGMVEAVGTEFSVRLLQAAVDVTVTEGRVAVLTRPDKSETHPVRRVLLVQGETVRYSNEVPAPRLIAPTEIARKLSWQQGFLVFEGQTLAEAVAEIGRYTSQRIEVADDVAELRIGGYFRAGDLDATLRALEGNFPLQIDQVADGSIRLSSRAAASPRQL